MPEWWGEVIEVEIRSKTDAKRIVKLCREGELQETWKPQWSTYLTYDGRIRLADFERAQDVLMGVADPGPGHPRVYDRDRIRELAMEIAEELPKPINRREVCRQLVERYNGHPRLKNPEAGWLQGLVRELFREK